MKHFFSIITINFNNIEGLKKSFESVINQTYKEVQYIIIDGGSTDGSKNFLLDNSQKIDFWVSERDEGIYHAMNKGIDMATGTYCLFLNSGDYLHSKEILQLCNEQMNEFDTSNSNDLVFVGSTQNEKSKIIFSPPNQFSLFHFYNNSIPHQGEFIPLKILKNNKYSVEYKSVSDWIKNIQFLLLGVQFVRLKSPKIISITENAGISGTEINQLERSHFLKKNLHLFNNFDCLIDLNDKKDLIQYKYFNKVINSNFVNKLLWKAMRISFKKVNE